MSSFVGNILCKIDSKGRIALPSAFRKQLSKQAHGSFVIKKDMFENCLVLLPYDEWERQVEKIRGRLNPFNRQHNRFLRNFFKDVSILTLDSNNRLLIPKEFLNFIEVSDEVFLIGLDRKIELWNKETFEKYITEYEGFNEDMEKFLNFNNE